MLGLGAAMRDLAALDKPLRTHDGVISVPGLAAQYGHGMGTRWARDGHALAPFGAVAPVLVLTRPATSQRRAA